MRNIDLTGVYVGREKLGIRTRGGVSLGENQAHTIRATVYMQQGVVDVELDQLLQKGFVGKAVRLTPRTWIVIRASMKVMQHASAVRWCIRNVDNATCLLLPRCVQGLLYAAEDVLGSVCSTSGAQTAQELEDWVSCRGEVEELDIGVVAVVLVTHHRHTHFGLLEECVFDVGHNRFYLLLGSVDIAVHRSRGIYEKQQVDRARFFE